MVKGLKGFGDEGKIWVMVGTSCSAQPEAGRDTDTVRPWSLPDVVRVGDPGPGQLHFCLASFLRMFHIFHPKGLQWCGRIN